MIKPGKGKNTKIFNSNAVKSVIVNPYARTYSYDRGEAYDCPPGFHRINSSQWGVVKDGFTYDPWAWKF